MKPSYLTGRIPYRSPFSYKVNFQKWETWPHLRFGPPGRSKWPLVAVRHPQNTSRRRRLAPRHCCLALSSPFLTSAHRRRPRFPFMENIGFHFPFMENSAAPSPLLVFHKWKTFILAAHRLPVLTARRRHPCSPSAFAHCSLLLLTVFPLSTGHRHCSFLLSSLLCPSRLCFLQLFIFARRCHHRFT